MDKISSCLKFPSKKIKVVYKQEAIAARESLIPCEKIRKLRRMIDIKTLKSLNSPFKGVEDFHLKPAPFHINDLQNSNHYSPSGDNLSLQNLRILQQKVQFKGINFIRKNAVESDWMNYRSKPKKFVKLKKKLFVRNNHPTSKYKRNDRLKAILMPLSPNSRKTGDNFLGSSRDNCLESEERNILPSSRSTHMTEIGGLSARERRDMRTVIKKIKNYRDNPTAVEDFFSHEQGDSELRGALERFASEVRRFLTQKGRHRVDNQLHQPDYQTQDQPPYPIMSNAIRVLGG